MAEQKAETHKGRLRQGRAGTRAKARSSAEVINDHHIGRAKVGGPLRMRGDFAISQKLPSWGTDWIFLPGDPDPGFVIEGYREKCDHPRNRASAAAAPQKNKAASSWNIPTYITGMKRRA